MRRGRGRSGDRDRVFLSFALALATLVAFTPAQAQPAAAARRIAERSTGFRVVVSVADRMLWVLSDADTLLAAPVAVGTGQPLEFGGRRWEFATPRGRHVIIGKTENGPWVPPDWHYAETASAYGLRLAQLPPDRPVRLSDGRQLVVRDSTVGLIEPDSEFAVLPIDEEIVFDGTLYVPPLATRNRHVPGVLGRYQLDLGGGYKLHGTPYPQSIGEASSHGCIRLHDPAIEWLYDNVPLGTPVYIY